MKKLVFVAVLALVAVPSGRAFQTKPPADLGVASTTGLVVSSSDVASDVGAAILAQGGNAVDAAVATAFALAVTYPTAGNIGGGGFMIVRTPDGNATTFDYREKAPGKATPTMYLDAQGTDRSQRSRAPAISRRACRAPCAAWRWRTRSSASCRGTTSSCRRRSSRRTASSCRRRSRAASTAKSRPRRQRVDDAVPGVGRRVRQARRRRRGPKAIASSRPTSARRSSAIANDGPDAFYTGWIADRIAEDMARQRRHHHEGRSRRVPGEGARAGRGTFLGYEIISMPPPSSGGVALIEMLNILEARRDSEEGARLAPRRCTSSTEAHAPRVSRSRALPRRSGLQSTVPVAKLISKPHARDAGEDDRSEAARRRASNSARTSSPCRSAASRKRRRTSRWSTDGMAVSNTYTLEGGYGSHVVIEGTGILLNNEMGDFNKKPGTTNLTGDIGTPANLIAPGKRMLSSMTPTIVARDGKLVLVTGSPGGRTIINTVLNVVLNVTAWGMTGRDAVDRRPHPPSVAAGQRDDRRRDAATARRAQGDRSRRAVRRCVRDRRKRSGSIRKPARLTASPTCGIRRRRRARRRDNEVQRVRGVRRVRRVRRVGAVRRVSLGC